MTPQLQIELLMHRAKVQQNDYILQNPNCPDVPPLINFLTGDERGLLHSAKLALPTYGEEREAAKARIQQRIKARK